MVEVKSEEGGGDGISVLMSLYKNEKKDYFNQAMESIVNQSLLPKEIVLIIDGPIPGDLENAVEQWKIECAFLKVYRLKENVQLGRALNKGVALCKNELVARMDTDDIMVPERLERQFQYMQEHSELSVLGGHMEEFDDARLYVKEKKMPHSYVEIIRYGRYRNPLNHMTVMFRKCDVLQVGNYQHFPFLEDYFLWIRMLAQGKKMENLPEILVYMRTNENVYQRRGGFKYFGQYCKLRKLQYQYKLLNFREYMTSILLTMSITLIPSTLRKSAYRKGLRK